MVLFMTVKRPVTTQTSASSRQVQSTVVQPPMEQHTAHESSTALCQAAGTKGPARLSLGISCLGALAWALGFPSTGERRANPGVKQTERTEKAEHRAYLGLCVP